MTSSEHAITGDSPERPTDAMTSDGTSRESFRSVFMYAVMLVLASLLAYENSFLGVFHFDDFPCIVTNHSLKSLSDTWNASGDEIPGGLRRRDVGRWTFAFNRSLHDLDPWGYHAVNLTIHLTAGLFLMGLVRRTMALPTMPPSIRRHSLTLAFCVSLLWIVHPLQTESVTYIVQRLESLMGMFFLASLYGLNRAALGGSRGWYLFSIGSAGLSIGTKEVGLMIVPVALLYDRIFLATDWPEILRKRAWVHGPILAAVLLYFVIGIGKVPFYVERPDAAGRRATSWEFLRSQPGVLLHYFQLAFWPRGLNLDHVWPVAHDRFEIYGKGAVILAILATGFGLLRRSPAIAFLILSYFFILAPSSTIVPLHLAFEHRVYLSLASLICGVVLLIFGCFTALERRTQRTGSLAIGATLLLSVTAALALSWATRERNKVYHSQVAMWNDVVGKSPMNARGHMNLAMFAAFEGNLEKAEKHYLFSLKIDPESSKRNYNYGHFLVERREEPQRALGYLEKAIELQPDFSVYHLFYAHTLEQLNQVDEAEAAYRRGIELDPEDPIGHLRLGQLRVKQERFTEAEQSLDHVAKLAPYLWQPHRELGQIDAAQGDFAAAIAHYQLAIDDPRSTIPQVFDDELAELREKLAAQENSQ